MSGSLSHALKCHVSPTVGRLPKIIINAFSALVSPRLIRIVIYYYYICMNYSNGFLVSKETVVLCWWERSKQKFGFIKQVDKG